MKNLFYEFLKSISLVFIIFIFSISGITAQSHKTDNITLEKTYERNKTIIESNSYEFRSLMVYDGSQREKNYSKVSFIENKLSGSLIPITSSKSSVVSFEKDRIKNYKVQTNDENQSVELSFDLASGEMSFQFNIRIMPNGKAFLKVYSLNEEIEYIGTIFRQ
ncbi:DUF4251 domain-containing protein [Winogradskyella sp. KYW1333]|uniref:DUF4251 domain-containing protein n=1 Tax=Winogradskyella sp. KYW1333 TaxID=2282123 RepID=UPI000DF19931|nr:DUF4251 domain-containing protein [Winogradskyella sp. KYW1333]RCT54210.1 DUF4251 domain-containing protein [Winogradskyella sp. KYW1333]